MALKSQFIDGVTQIKGQLWLTFFFTVSCYGHANAELVLSASQQQHASAGVLSAQQWIKGLLSQHSPYEWIHFRSQAGVVKHWPDWGLGVARSRVGYLHANSNAMVLSAQDALNDRVDLSNQGVFALMAKGQTLESTIFSVEWKRALTNAFELTLVPHLHSIHDYQRSEGQLTLQTVGTQSRLQGNLSRVGTRNYGFLVNDRDNAGWGWGLDIGLKWNSAWGEAHVHSSNALSKLHFSNIHFSDRQYDVNTHNGQDLILSAIPSVQGVYGLLRTTENLPATWQIRFVPRRAQHISIGLTGMESDARWFATYGQRFLQYRWWVKTVEAKNWSAVGEWQISDRWSLSAGLTATRVDNPVISSFKLSATW